MPWFLMTISFLVGAIVGCYMYHYLTFNFCFNHSLKVIKATKYDESWINHSTNTKFVRTKYIGVVECLKCHKVFHVNSYDDSCHTVTERKLLDAIEIELSLQK